MVAQGKKITLVMEGPVENGGHLELSVFAEKLKHLLDLLNGSVNEDDKKAVVFRVVHVSHSSPVTVECQPMGNNASACDAALNVINKNLTYVKENKLGHLSRHDLNAIEQLAKFSPNKIERVELRVTESETVHKIYKLDDDFKEQLDNARREEERVIITIDGKLEQINIHNEANTCRIYTSLPVLPYVNCKFPQNLLEKVQSSLGSFVSVSGECFYRPDEAVP